jgi:hypothetical protein
MSFRLRFLERSVDTRRYHRGHEVGEKRQLSSLGVAREGGAFTAWNGEGATIMTTYNFAEVLQFVQDLGTEIGPEEAVEAMRARYPKITAAELAHAFESLATRSPVSKSYASAALRNASRARSWHGMRKAGR